jgi:hypothetical protein
MQWRTGEASLIKVNGTTTRTAFHRRPYRSCSTRTGSDRAWPPRKRSCSHVLLERHEVRAAGRGDMLDQRSRRSRTRHWSPSPGTGGPQARPCRMLRLATSMWLRWFFGRLSAATASGRGQRRRHRARDQAGRESDAHGASSSRFGFSGATWGRIARGEAARACGPDRIATPRARSTEGGDAARRR